MTTFANRELTELNISTLVYMLDTNIRIDPDKLVTIFKDIEPIPSVSYTHLTLPTILLE